MRRVLIPIAVVLGIIAGTIAAAASPTRPPDRPLPRPRPLPVTSSIPHPSTTTTTLAPVTTTAPTTTSTTRPAAPARITTTTSPVACPAADIIRATWPADAADQAIRIAYRESRCLGWPVSPTNCRGLFQLYSGWDALYRELGLDPANWADPWTNSTVAAEIYRRSGWGPWAL